MILALLSAFAAGPAMAWTPPPAALKALSQGKAWAEVSRDKDGFGLIHAMVDIAAPPDVVWSIMSDCAMAARLVTSVISCRVLQTGPGGRWDVREHVTKGNLFLPTIRSVFRSDYEPHRRIAFRRIEGDLKAMEGEWRLEPIDGGAGTRVTYINHVSARIFAPAAVVREGMRRDTPKVLANLRREALAAALTR